MCNDDDDCLNNRICEVGVCTDPECSEDIDCAMLEMARCATQVAASLGPIASCLNAEALEPNFAAAGSLDGGDDLIWPACRKTSVPTTYSSLHSTRPEMSISRSMGWLHLFT